MSPLVADPSPELYVSDCCGTVFTPGYGPDDIVSSDGDRDARRGSGQCPVCGATDPDLWEVQ